MREGLNYVIDKHTMHPGGVELVYSTLLQLQNDGPQGSDASFTLCLHTKLYFALFLAHLILYSNVTCFPVIYLIIWLQS